VRVSRTVSLKNRRAITTLVAASDNYRSRR
jgi:hypothetical protein